MRPQLPSFYVADGRSVNCVVGGNQAVSSLIGSNRKHLLLGQFYTWMFGALKARLSALGNFVCHVVGVRAEKQVFWIHATRVVAAMEDLQAGRNWPDLQFISGPTRGHADAPNCHASVTLRVVGGGYPQDAPICVVFLRRVERKPIQVGHVAQVGSRHHRCVNLQHAI